MIQSCATTDDGPELPSKSGMNLAETPPAPGEVLIAGLLQLSAKSGFSDSCPQLSLKHLPHRAAQSRDRDEYRDALFTKSADDLRCLDGFEKQHRPTNHWRYENAHKLP